MKNPKTISQASKKTYTATSILENIQKNIRDMKSNWDKIRAYNITDKGAKPHFDIKKIYTDIVRLESEIVDLKLYSLCINLGYKSIDQIPKDSAFVTIYVLSQLKSRKDNLLTIKTKYNNKTENITLDKKFIDKEVLSLDKEIIKCSVELTEFNKQASLVA